MFFDLDFLYTGEDIRPKGNAASVASVPRGYEFDDMFRSAYDPFPWLTQGLDIRSDTPQTVPRGYEFDGVLTGNTESDFPWLDTGEDIRNKDPEATEQSVERGHEFDYIMENYLRELADELAENDGIYYPGLKEYEYGVR